MRKLLGSTPAPTVALGSTVVGLTFGDSGGGADSEEGFGEDGV